MGRLAGRTAIVTGGAKGIGRHYSLVLAAEGARVMIADVADYSEWKNHRRATAIVFSAMLCGLKFGLSVGSALVAAILAAYGYDASLTTQAPEVVHGIQLAVSIYCSIPFLLCVALLFAYEVDKSMETLIEHELGARRAGAATPA
jgi:Na+/melibiose symporter-like transporter